MLNAILNNLINIGWAMLIFLAAYLSNVSFSMFYNIKIQLQPFDRDKLITSALKVGSVTQNRCDTVLLVCYYRPRFTPLSTG